MANSVNITQLLNENTGLTENSLNEYLTDMRIGETVLSDAIRYSVLGGGKRIRAFLCRHFCRMLGGCDKKSDPFSVAIEVLHAYSLIHDDMPCMDNDDFRRGKPSTHKAFGEGEALLAGDAMLTLAFEIAASNNEICTSQTLEAVRILAEAAGAVGMCGGQHIDLAHSAHGYEELKDLHRKKTGALIFASCMMGATAVRPLTTEETDAVMVYAYGIGLAFQIIDDILDVISTPEMLGKNTGADERDGKVTVLSFMSLDEAKREAEHYTNEAKRAIAVFPNNEALLALADSLLERTR